MLETGTASVNQALRTPSQPCMDISHLVSVFLIRQHCRALVILRSLIKYMPAAPPPAPQFIQLARLFPHVPPILPLVHMSHVNEDMSQSMQFPASSSTLRVVAGR